MLVLSKKSWHYRLAKIAKYSWKIEVASFCEYVRYVLIGLLLFTCMAFIIGVLAVGNIIGVYTLFTNPEAWSTQNVYAMINIVTAGTIGVLTFIVGLVRGKDKLSDYLEGRRNPPTKEPSFIATWYRSNKEKFCPSITFVNK